MKDFLETWGMWYFYKIQTLKFLQAFPFLSQYKPKNKQKTIYVHVCVCVSPCIDTYRLLILLSITRIKWVMIAQKLKLFLVRKAINERSKS